VLGGGERRLAGPVPLGELLGDVGVTLLERTSAA
jgi:hypothetical protein